MQDKSADKKTGSNHLHNHALHHNLQLYKGPRSQFPMYYDYMNVVYPRFPEIRYPAYTGGALHLTMGVKETITVMLEVAVLMIMEDGHSEEMLLVEVPGYNSPGEGDAGPPDGGYKGNLYVDHLLDRTYVFLILIDHLKLVAFEPLGIWR